MGDLGEVRMKSDTDDAGAFGRFNGEMRFERRGDNTDGGSRVWGMGFTEGSMVDGGNR